MTDNDTNNTVETEDGPTNQIDSPDYGFGFSPLEQVRIALFGPTPAMIDRMNKHLTEMSEADQRHYGQRVAMNFLADPINEVRSADYLIDNAQQLGVVLPELVKQVARETVDNAPRDTFEQALQRASATGSSGDESVEAELAKLREAEASVDEDTAYQNGFDTGKLYQTGWNTAQFTGQQMLELVEAEGGQLSDATKRGILDAYAHYTPVEVAVSQATAAAMVAEAF